MIKDQLIVEIIKPKIKNLFIQKSNDKEEKS